MKNKAKSKKITINNKKNGATSAVIDIGTSAIRMSIAQIDEYAHITILESLQQSIALGKDTFTRGIISKDNIQACVRVLKSYRRILKEWGIDNNDSVRVLASTAVREASNKDAFVDRVYIATGFSIEIIDEIDVARLTYLGIKACKEAYTFKWSQHLLIAEMSGGSTEILQLEKDKVTFSHSYRLGALRLREALDLIPAPLKQHRNLMENDIIRTVNQIANDISKSQQRSLVALGGDIRIAASSLYPEWNQYEPFRISIPLLTKFTNSIFLLTIDEIVQQFHLSFSDAETIGPSLLFYLHLARILNLKSIIVTGISMRSGIMIEMKMHGVYTEEFIQQIIHSAIETGRKYQFDEQHGNHVADLSSTIFKALKKEHGLGSEFELPLRIASILHDIGTFINIRSHHKHSMYIIQNSELFGLSKNNLMIISLIARYHRRSAPKPEHDFYDTLSREQRLAVVKLAAIVRIADALDRSNKSRIDDIECEILDDSLVIYISGIDDFSLEQYSIRSKGTLFEDVYGLKIVLRKKNNTQEQQ